MKELLSEIGINAGLITSGLFGSLLNIKKDASTRISTVLFSIIAGVGSANYITPIVIDFINIHNRNFEFGIAFILGYLGLNGIEFAIKKLIKFDLPVKEPVKRKRRARRKSPPNWDAPVNKKRTPRRRNSQE